jgi:hypothetical protein
VLNAARRFIFTVGLTIVMVMAGIGVAAGPHDGRRLRAGQRLLIQLYLPLNFLGSVYRDIKQGLIDIENMFELLKVAPRSPTSRAPGRWRCASGDIVFDTWPSPTTRARRSCTTRLRGAAGQDLGHRRSRRAPASRRSRGCCSASTR